MATSDPRRFAPDHPAIGSSDATAAAAPGQSPMTPPPAEAARSDAVMDGTITVRRPAAAAPVAVTSSGHCGDSATLGQALAGRRLAHFALEESVGAGGMAAVVRAHDLQLDRTVALKILPPDLAADPDNLRRFENEARAAAKLDHDNIARVFYCGADQGLHFIAFEYVEGENLRSLLDRRGPLPAAEALRYVLQVALGLVHAAARGVVHRDIKPSNVIVAADGRVKLVDMGLARSGAGIGGDALTQSGVTLGTYDYLSPEQALDPRRADSRSDIYSLGCTLYHLLTGVAPVPPGTAARKLQAHQNEEPADPRHLNPAVPVAVAALLSRMMAKKPEDRYQTPDELVDHLRLVLISLGAAPGAVDALPAVAPDLRLVQIILARRAPTRRPHSLLVAAAVVLVILFCAYSQFLTSSGPPSLPDDYRNAAGPPGNAAPVGGAAVAPAPPGVAAPGEAVTPPEREARTTGDLVRAAAENFRGRLVLKAPVFDLGGADAARSDGADSPASGVRFDDCALTIEGPPGPRPVLRFDGGAPFAARGTSTAALVLRGGELRLFHIRIEIGRSGTRELGPLAALLVQGGHLILQDCELVQAVGDDSEGPFFRRAVTTLHVQPTAPRNGGPEGATRAVVELRDCVLYGGRQGIVADEGADVSLSGCVLGPFDQPVRLGAVVPRTRGVDGGTLAQQLARRTGFTCHSCSWLLSPLAAIRVDTRQPCRINVSRSILSAPQTLATGGGNGTTLVLLGPDAATGTEFRSEANYYHNVPTLVAQQDRTGRQEPLAADLADLPHLTVRCRDDGSLKSAVSPWDASDPVRDLAAGDAVSAFRAQIGLAALRLPPPAFVLGPRTVLGVALYRHFDLESTSAAQDLAPAAPPSREFVVDGKGHRPGAFATIKSALGAVESDAEAVILLKVNGPVAVRTEELGVRNVTLRAADGYAPELAAHADTVPDADGDAALFRLHDGSLALEGVAVRIHPAALRESPRLLALVAVSGTGRCRFKGCRGTFLGEPGMQATLALVADPTGAMAGTAGSRPPRPGLPRVELEDCFLRGQGDVLNVRVSRAFQLDARNVTTALQGTLITADGNKADMGMPAEAATVTLDHVTALATGGLLYERATTARPAHVPLRVTAAACLFATADGGPLVRLEGLQGEEDLRRRLSWQGRRNVYAPAGPLLLWQPLERAELAQHYDAQRWAELFGRDDEEAQFARSVKFAAASDPMASPSRLAPADLRVLTAEPLDVDTAVVGADWRRLPAAATGPAIEP